MLDFHRLSWCAAGGAGSAAIEPGYRTHGGLRRHRRIAAAMSLVLTAATVGVILGMATTRVAVAPAATVLSSVERVAGRTSPGGTPLPLAAFTAASTPVTIGSALVYLNAQPDTSFVVRSAPNGASQTLIDITGAGAPTDFHFAFPLPVGASFAPRADGGADIISSSGALIGSLAAPWAVDAAGHHIRTSYRFAGSVVTQTVEHHGATYPVVADPQSWWSTLGRWAKRAAARFFFVNEPLRLYLQSHGYSCPPWSGMFFYGAPLLWCSAPAY